MSVYIPQKLRKLVAERAKGHCEYCLHHESDSYTTFQVDHIISLRHGGITIAINLAYACLFCNRYKGSDVGTVLLPKHDFVRLFNPRLDSWQEHFAWEELVIVPLSNIGEATIKILDLNNLERIMERQILLEAGRLFRLV
jgi:hypothetical protein